MLIQCTRYQWKFCWYLIKLGKAKSWMLNISTRQRSRLNLFNLKRGKLENIGISFLMELKSAQPEDLEQGWGSSLQWSGPPPSPLHPWDQNIIVISVRDILSIKVGPWVGGDWFQVFLPAVRETPVVQVVFSAPLTSLFTLDHTCNLPEIPNGC